MTRDDADARIAALRQEVESLHDLLRLQGLDSAEVAMAATRRDYRLGRELKAERARISDADLRAEAESERADRSEQARLDLLGRHEQLMRDAEFTRQVLESTTDCITVLDLQGKLEFMSAGGMRVMEIEDAATVAMRPWIEFWHGAERRKAVDAVASAETGGTARFEGTTSTAKGSPRWWEVTVSPIPGAGGKPARLLSISRDITARYLADQARRVLLEEMHHRVKNVIVTIQGIARQTLRDVPDADRALQQRLVALGQAHDLLVQNEWISADIRQVVTDAVEAYLGDATRMTVSGDPFELSSAAALSLAMLMNELCTNAVKHGAWSREEGIVDISWTKEDSAFRFRWSERDGPAVTEPARRGFGMRLITDVLPAGLGGKAALSLDPRGLVFELEAPLSALVVT